MLNVVGTLQSEEILKNKDKDQKYKGRKNKEHSSNEIRTKSAKKPKSERRSPHK